MWDMAHGASRRKHEIVDRDRRSAALVPPDWTWHPYIRREFPLPTLRRPDLIIRILTERSRWTSLIGSPGTGRTTALIQAAEELAGAHADHLVYWAGSPIGTLTEGRTTAPCSTAELIERIRDHTERGAELTVLIDDFDWMLHDGSATPLMALLADNPLLRLVTVSLDAPPVPPALATAIGVVRTLRTPQLAFSYEELEEVYRLWTAESGEGALLGTSDLRKLWEESGGVPLGCVIAIDRTRDMAARQAFSLAYSMAAINAVMMERYPRELLHSGFGSLFEVMSYLPRFTLAHVTLLAPHATPSAIEELLASQALQPRRAVLPDEFVWARPAWQMFAQWNTPRRERRREIATLLQTHGDISGAFEQWLLCGDYARAETVLRERFLSIYEGITPEGAEILCRTAWDQLRRHPFLSVLSILLTPGQCEEKILSCVDLLAQVAKRTGSSHTALSALAVRGTILARQGHGPEALRQAKNVLRRLARMEQAGSSISVLPAEEARLMAVLTFLAEGSFPAQRIPPAPALGEQLLDHRRALAQRLMNIQWIGSAPGVIHQTGLHPSGYRTLIASDIDLIEDIEAFGRYDRLLYGAYLTEGGRPDGSWLSDHEDLDEDVETSERPLPRVFLPGLAAVRSAVAGNIDEALRQCYRPDVPEPTGSLLHVYAALLKSEYQEALDLLDRFGSGWGQRMQTIAKFLSIEARLGLGRHERARRTLDQLSDVDIVALVQAATLVTETELVFLEEHSAHFAAIARAARRVGTLGLRSLRPSSAMVPALTQREREILEGLHEGLNNKELGEKHFLSVNTVKTHIRSLSKKLGAKGRSEAIRRAKELRILH